MSKHLLLVTLGPVQDSIAAARRTRDLAYGSHLLSELSRRAAWKLAESGAQLIFPALVKDDPELTECLSPLRPKHHPNAGNAPLNVANKIVAEITASKDPAVRAKAVRDDLQEFWKGIAADVKRNCAGLLASDIDEAWDEQIDTFIEFSAAWAPLTDGDYDCARRAVEQAIAARKNLRDFDPWQKQRGAGGKGVPKSSLDGARETVLAKPGKRWKKLVHKYRIADGEQLDAVGLVKRAGGETDESRENNDLQFVPLANVALASWLKAATSVAPEAFETLREAARAIKLPRITRNLPCVAAFRFDASIFLENRLWPTFKEDGLLEHADAETWRALVKDWGETYVDPILKSAPRKPVPYVACLVADGDGMGKAIDAISRGKDAAENHRKFSAKLSDFAREARRIVEQEHLGSLVYSGGDDVLAFLPLSTALDCADRLRLCFEAIMAESCPDFDPNERPTLSIGLGIGHVLESMGDLLSLGRSAEKLAKGGHIPNATERRNAVAIILDKRSGGQRKWRARWDEWPSKGPTDRLEDDARLIHGTLSTRKVFEIARTLRRFPKPSSGVGPEWADMLALEVDRSLARVDTGGDRLDATKVGLALPRADYKAAHEAVADWVERMLIAKMFAEADPSPRGKSANTAPAGSNPAEHGRAA